MDAENWKETVDEAVSGLSYLDDVAQEYELDSPNYTHNLQEFKRRKQDKLSDIYSQLSDIVSELNDYTTYVDKPHA